MSSPRNSSSGTGGRHRSRLPHRPPSERGWVAAALYGLGAALTLVALYTGWILLLLGGCRGSDGHIDTGVWIGGAAIFLIGAAWAARSPRRAWWGLPLSMLVAAVFVLGLATLLTGSTGWCPD